MEQYRTRNELRAAIRDNNKEMKRLNQAMSDSQGQGASGFEGAQKAHEAAVVQSRMLADLWTHRGYK
ncbi:MAG: hypothetical protein WB615_11340 [Candidatus Tumulicola sp.]